MSIFQLVNDPAPSGCPITIDLLNEFQKKGKEVNGVKDTKMLSIGK